MHFPNNDEYYLSKFNGKFVKKNDKEFLNTIANEIVNEFEKYEFDRNLIREADMIENKVIKMNKVANSWNYTFMDIVLKNK